MIQTTQLLEFHQDVWPPKKHGQTFGHVTQICAVRSLHSGETPDASTIIQKKPSREEGALSSPNYLEDHPYLFQCVICFCDYLYKVPHLTYNMTTAFLPLTKWNYPQSKKTCYRWNGLKNKSPFEKCYLELGEGLQKQPRSIAKALVVTNSSTRTALPWYLDIKSWDGVAGALDLVISVRLLRGNLKL